MSLAVPFTGSLLSDYGAKSNLERASSGPHETEVVMERLNLQEEGMERKESGTTYQFVQFGMTAHNLDHRK